MITRMLDWRLRSIRHKSNLPDLPEVRRLMRACWWNGFTGTGAGKITALKAEALAAIARHDSEAESL